MMTSEDSSIIYQHNGGVVEHTISTDDEEGVLSKYIPSDSTNAPPPPSPPQGKIKKYAVPISVSLFALSAVAVAAVVWRPGGPGNPAIESNLSAVSKGIEMESNKTYFPTVFPTSMPSPLNGTAAFNETATSFNVTVSATPSPKPTLDSSGLSSPPPSPPSDGSDVPTSSIPTVMDGTTTPTVMNGTTAPTAMNGTIAPTAMNGTTSPVASPTLPPMSDLSTPPPSPPSDGSDVPTSYVPTVMNNGTTVPSPKPTLDLSFLMPSPPPMESTTPYPTNPVTSDGSATVSTETTGPPTAANRPTTARA